MSDTYAERRKEEVRHAMTHVPDSQAEEMLALHLRAHKIFYLREFQFTPDRKWRFDFAITRLGKGGRKIAIEINGGGWKRGRHHTATGSEADWEKLNCAQLLGWAVLQYSARQVRSGVAIDQIVGALGHV